MTWSWQSSARRSRLGELADGTGANGISDWRQCWAGFWEGSDELVIRKIEEWVIPSLEVIEKLSVEFIKILENIGILAGQCLLHAQEVRPSRSSMSLSKFSDQVRQSAAVVEDLGARLESATLDADSGVREAWFYLSRANRGELTKNNVKTAMSEVLRRVSELQMTENSVSGVLEDLRPIESGNVPLRTALRPLRNGVRGPGAAAVVQSWRDLLGR